MPEVVFFMSSRIHGGAESQMAMLASQAATDGYEVTVIDSPARIVADLIDPNSPISIVVRKHGQRISVNNSVVVTQASYIFNLDSMLELVNCELRFWFMHPLNLPHIYLASRLPGVLAFLLRKYSNFVCADYLSVQQNSLFYQSADCRRSLEKFYGISLNPRETGVLVEEVRPIVARANKPSGDGLNFGWLGRLDALSKYLALKKIMSDVANSKNCHEGSVFHIVGDGPVLEDLRREANRLGIAQKTVFHGHVLKGSLVSIISKCDVIFAHGTSVFEAVKAGVPVALIDFYTREKDIVNMKYRLYSDDNDPTLGYLIDGLSDFKTSGSRSFDALIAYLRNANAAEEVISRQIEKLMLARNLGEKKCREIYLPNGVVNSKPKALLLDRLFLKLKYILERFR
jgi:hypothetical protein